MAQVYNWQLGRAMEYPYEARWQFAFVFNTNRCIGCHTCSIVGFYPQLAESGERKEAPHLAHLGSRVARHALYLAAVNAVRRSAEWRTLYLRKKAQGKQAKQALIVVAVKLLHTIYAMLRDRRPYQPSRLLVAPATIGA
jgi:hypothetical protein